MEISSRNARMWARMGARAFYGQAFSDIASKNHEIIGMSADLGRSSGLDRFSKEYPDQFINCFDHVNRNSNCTCLVSDRTSNCLSNPPSCVG